MTPEDINLLFMIITPLVTAVTTASITAKANERVLKDISARMDDLEERLFNHEKRLSRIEGSLSKEARA